MNKVLTKFFYPNSVCIVGASAKKGTLGFELTRCVKSYGYKGKLFLVNPKAKEIGGIKCNTSIDQINEDIDLAIVMVPKQIVRKTISELINKGVQAIILITAGFSETG